MDPMWVLGAILVAAFVVLVFMVAKSTRSNTRVHTPKAPVRHEPVRDEWEEALLANTPDTPNYPGAPRAAASTGLGGSSGLLDRDALQRAKGEFDPSAWDDNPDGYEGTDFGMVGDADR